MILKDLTIPCLLEHVLLNNDNRASCCWLHQSLFSLILPFYLFTKFFIISPIYLANRIAYIYIGWDCLHTYSQSYKAISQIRMIYWLLQIKIQTYLSSFLRMFIVKWLIYHLVSFFLVLISYTYKDQSKFIFKTSRQQATSTVASFFHHLFFIIDNLTFLETISPRATDCVWPRTRELAYFLL